MLAWGAMRRSLCAVYALGAAVGGCLLTTPLDGLSDTSSSPAADAMADGGDATVDAVVNDGPADTSPDADAAVADFRCTIFTPAPVFCSDFDMGTSDSVFGTPILVLGGSVTFDDTIFVSRSRSLRLMVPVLPAGAGNGRATIGRSFPVAAATSTIELRFDMHIDSADTDVSSTAFFSMGAWDLTLFVGTTSRLREGTPGDGGLDYKSTDRTPPALGHWVNASLTLALGAGSSSATIAYDGVKQSAVPLVAHTYRAASIRVDVGFSYVSSPDNGRDMHIDNLVVDMK